MGLRHFKSDTDHNHNPAMRAQFSKPLEGDIHNGKDKAIRDKLTEKQIDKTIKDSFPASDPPSTY